MNASRINTRESRDTAIEHYVEGTLWLALGASICFAVYVLLIGIKTPILDNFTFRQTQTALTTYWLTHGGPWFAYETPVLGAPWSIPFEFPVFQLIAAGVASLGVHLDVAGRSVNFAFYLATLWPLGMLSQTLGLSRAGYLATAILYVLSPTYLYWSRTFLIESCALFFAVLWLAYLARFVQSGSKGAAVGMVVTGSLAILAKATTFPAFVLVGGLGVFWVLVSRFRAGTTLGSLARLAGVSLLLVAIPFIIGFLWVAYTDSVKSGGEFGRLLTSSALSTWGFGSTSQKLSRDLWVNIIARRIIPDAMGYLYLLGLAVVIVAFSCTRNIAIAAVSIVGFLASILAFTNLHMVHTYYQVANALFLAIAVGVCLGVIFDRGNYVVATTFLFLIAAGQIALFVNAYKPIVETDQHPNWLWQVATMANHITDPEKSLIVLGDDWSSAVAYYSKRKTLTVPGWTPPELAKKIFSDPQQFLGNNPLGAIVVCDAGLKDYKRFMPLVERFLADRKQLGRHEGCRILSAQLDKSP